MKKKPLYIFIIILIGVSYNLKADEGMWLVNMINKNYDDMKKQGFKLSSKDIYDINNASLKDAVVWFNGYCTGSIISNRGLVLTNHHCGYEFISKLSTPADNMLKYGWYSEAIGKDKPVEDLWIGILKKIKDITPLIEKQLKDVDDKRYESELNKYKLEIIRQAELQNKNYRAYIKDIFGNSQYILITVEIFNDIRLVGTPPESLGKFGGNKDNWMWPRHTADFSLFRIYASGNNEPALYSERNIPYTPKKFIKTSLKGYDKNSFSLIMGYPGTTNRYAASFETAFKNKKIYPAISSIRGISMASWDNEMQKNAAAKLQLSNIYQGISNYEKYYKGLVQGITAHQIIQKLEDRENAFLKWSGKQTYIQDYNKTFSKWQQLYDQYSDIIIWKTYSDELINASPILRMAVKFLPIGRTYNNKGYDLANVMVKSIEANDLFANFNYNADMEILPSLMLELWKNTTYEHLPKVLDVITEEYGDDALEAFQNYTHEAFLHSIFSSKDRYNKFLERSDTSKSQILLNDPIYKLVEGIFDQYDQDIGPKYELFSKLEKEYRTEYILGLQLMNPTKLFYPDANLTPRITYGKVRNYDPTDGIEYNYFTTTEGLLEKNLLRDPEYKLSQTIIKKLKKANESKYTDSDGKLHVCFITDNDITGGNSGSPILNDKLELIGVAFDGNWESIPGQIYFDPNYNRSIGLDIRFILWCIDNLADAKHIVKEILYGS